jgi:hypothetical protein
LELPANRIPRASRGGHLHEGLSTAESFAPNPLRLHYFRPTLPDRGGLVCFLSSVQSGRDSRPAAAVSAAVGASGPRSGILPGCLAAQVSLSDRTSADVDAAECLPRDGHRMEHASTLRRAKHRPLNAAALWHGLTQCGATPPYITYDMLFKTDFHREFTTFLRSLP